jgi:hypothetical protein
MSDNWMIIGQRMADGDGVVLLASNDLVGDVHIREIDSIRERSVTIDMRVRPGYVKVRAATFDQALSMLFAQWHPPGTNLQRELLAFDPEHPDYCLADVGCSLEAGHDGPCRLDAALARGPLPRADGTVEGGARRVAGQFAAASTTSTLCPGCGQNRALAAPPLPSGRVEFVPHHTAHNGVDGPLCTMRHPGDLGDDPDGDLDDDYPPFPAGAPWWNYGQTDQPKPNTDDTDPANNPTPTQHNPP